MKRTDSLCRAARATYERGLSLEDVAPMYNVTPRTLRSWILRAGGKIRSLKRAWKLRKARMAQ